jgi:hypothetical protein
LIHGQEINDVGVIETSEGLNLALKGCFQALLVTCGLHTLESHELACLQVNCLLYRAHAARPDLV